MSKPFGEDEDEIEVQQKIGLKKVSSQKSIFDSMPKKPSQEDLTKKVEVKQQKVSQYKVRTADLAIKFNKVMSDKTLLQNKNIIQKELENELLRDMVKLAQDVNEDINERDGEGSLSWIVLLLKTALNQRDKINYLEYTVSQLEKKIDPARLTELIVKVLDSKKNGE